MVFMYLIFILAYFIGGIPIGYLIARLKGIADIRSHGSGNIGATNVARVLGWPYFVLIFLLDAGKAFLFIFFLNPYFDSIQLYIAITCLFLGNIFSPFLQGRGGKGVATLYGLLAALHPIVVLLLLSIWVLLLIIIKIVGIASVGAAVSLPLLVYSVSDNYMLFFFSWFCALMIIWTHRNNIHFFWEQWCKKV
jgi:acyl phosphate:glycerol-3-phosphate acyltransferase